MNNLMEEGLKDYFKQEQLSDRILKVVEIDESFSLKRKHCINQTERDLQNLKKLKTIDEDCILTEGTCKEGQDIDKHSRLPVEVKLHPSTEENGVMKKNYEEQNNLCDKSLEQLSGDSSQHPKRETVYSTFPVHSIVLCLSSAYFKSLLVDSGMAENEMPCITLKVNRGEGRYLERLIETFYNPDTLNTMTLSELLSTLDVAARFSCLRYLKLGLTHLNESNVRSVNDCDVILTHLSNILTLCNQDDKSRYNKIRNKCTTYLAKKLFPLEVNTHIHRIFYSLSCETLTRLLESGHTFCVTENNVLLFVHQWLAENEQWQTEKIVSIILPLIRHQNLFITQFCDCLTIDNKVFGVWSGYAAWYANVLQHHVLTPSQRLQRGIKDVSSDRVQPPVFANICSEQLFSLDKQTHEFSCALPSRLVWGGGFLEPLVSLKKIERDYFIKLKMSFVNAFHQPGKAINQSHEIYYILLPGNIEFTEAKLHESRFIQRYVRKSSLSFANGKTVCNFHTVAKANDLFLGEVYEHGLKLVILFTGVTLSWTRCSALKKVKSHKKIVNLHRIVLPRLSSESSD